MKTSTWIALDVALALVAAVVTLSVRKMVSAPLPKIPEEKQAKSTKEQERKPVPAKHRISSSVSDVIWQKSLFRPDRTEDLAADSDGALTADAVDQQQANSEFELTGIAQIGDKEKSQPIAIIIQSSQNRGRRPITRGPGGARLPGAPRGGNGSDRFQPRPNDSKDTAENKLKTTFKVGDPINQSGYTLTSINLDEDSVTLTRGAETVTLKITLGDDASKKRKELAVNQAENLKKQRAAAEAASAPKPAPNVQKPSDQPQPGQPPQQANRPQGSVPPQTPPNGTQRRNPPPGMPNFNRENNQNPQNLERIRNYRNNMQTNFRRPNRPNSNDTSRQH